MTINRLSKWQKGFNSGLEEAARALEADAKRCDCFARDEGECGCGAWCEWKSITTARAVEIVRNLAKIPPPEGDGGHRRSDGGEWKRGGANLGKHNPFPKDTASSTSSGEIIPCGFWMSSK